MSGTKHEAQLEAMIAAACFQVGSEAAFTVDLRAFLESHGVDAEDVAEILAAPPRLALYRRLIRNNVTGVTGKMLKRTRARMESAAPGTFDASFASFLEEVGPRTHYLRDVPGEFLDWALPRWRERTELPPWISDFARYELAEFQVAAAASPAPPEVTDVRPDQPLVFAEPARLLRFAYAVQALPRDDDDRSEPAARASAVLLYRDEDHAVQSLDLSPFAAAITERLLRGDTFVRAVGDAAAELGRQAGRLDVAQFLADLGERRVLLGGAVSRPER
jgi:hypothetical protein